MRLEKLRLMLRAVPSAIIVARSGGNCPEYNEDCWSFADLRRLLSCETILIDQLDVTASCALVRRADKTVFLKSRRAR